MNKEELRNKFLKIRKSIIDKDNKSQLIAENICNFEAFYKAKTIGLYSSLANEVDTKYIIEKMSDKRYAFPKVVGEELKFYLVNDLNDLKETDTFGIKEPESDETKLINKDDMDLIIVPGICFDSNKNRIGFGKGFYDRYLKDFKGLKIAICFDEQILKNEIINVSNNDIPMDIIISEKGIY